ncbi:unnamed protein product [Amoebophrya sp. A25]|nr:unnamed protein product [Amoebophrya sp. A25]|eukprot:GSA25T00003482001.1
MYECFKINLLFLCKKDHIAEDPSMKSIFSTTRTFSVDFAPTSTRAMYNCADLTSFRFSFFQIFLRTTRRRTVFLFSPIWIETLAMSSPLSPASKKRKMPSTTLTKAEIDILDGNDRHPALLRLLDTIKTTKTSSAVADLVGSTEGAAKEHPFLCTHHGGFHCDEALALGMLKLLPQFADMPILRTRDPSLIQDAKLVVDVGGIYDHEKLRYDHHMGDFTTMYSENHNVTKLSSAGLVFKHYGTAIVKEFIKQTSESAGSEVDPSAFQDSDIAKIVLKLYRNFIEEVDAIDNGVEPAETLKYRISTGLGSRVKRLNPSWREENVSSATENTHFKKAMMICTEEFWNQLSGLVEEWYPARKIVDDAVVAAKDTRILVLPRCCPWQEHLLDIEREQEERTGEPIPEDQKMLYVIFPDSRSGSFRIQAVPKVKGSFENRKPLPKPWRGVRDSDLSSVTGIPGGVFVHASGFIGGNQTLEGATAMAKAAVNF